MEAERDSQRIGGTRPRANGVGRTPRALLGPNSACRASTPGAPQSNPRVAGSWEPRSIHAGTKHPVPNPETPELADESPAAHWIPPRRPPYAA